MQLVHTNYNYAGFRYEIWQDEKGLFYAAALPAQHEAAYKYKHAVNAAEQFRDEYDWIDKL